MSEHGHRLLAVELCATTEELGLKVCCVDGPSSHAFWVVETEEKVDAITYGRRLDSLSIAFQLNLIEKSGNEVGVDGMLGGADNVSEEQRQADVVCRGERVEKRIPLVLGLSV